MKKAVITPSPLRGRITAPPSKSDAHRAIICACLSKGRCNIKNIALSKDILATIGAVRALGAEIEINGSCLNVNAEKMFTLKNAVIDCGESASTLRFMLCTAAAGGTECTFTGHGRLPQRPLRELTALLSGGGAHCSDEHLPLTLSGRLSGGRYEISGNVSSQYISGLLMALPLCSEDSELTLTSPLQSAGYVEMTLSTLARFGIKITPAENGWHIRGNQVYTPTDYTVEGDWSQAAFFLAAGAMGGEIEVCGLDMNSRQGDKEIFTLLKKMGADIFFKNSSVICRKSKLRSADINASQIPDLVPVLSVLLAFSEGSARITNAERLRIKESDRLCACVSMLKSMGIAAEETPDGISVPEKADFCPCTVQSFGDHRIVMAASAAASCALGEITVEGCESIDKSYPAFFRDYNSLGGKANVISLRQGI